MIGFETIIGGLSGLVAGVAAPAIAHFSQKNKYAFELEKLKANNLYSMHMAKLNFEVKKEDNISKEHLSADTIMGKAVDASAQQSGIRWIDGWSQAMRPAITTGCLYLLVAHGVGWVKLDPNVLGLAAAVVMFWFGQRTSSRQMNLVR